MGGMGNVAEMRTALLSVLGRKLGMERVREVDPWFFPDERWVRGILSGDDGKGKEGGGEGKWRIEQLEREFRPTPVDKGGVEGWIKLMGKQFFDVLGEGEERKEAEKEVCEVLKSVCRSPGGGDWIGYVRLRGLLRKV